MPALMPLGGLQAHGNGYIGHLSCVDLLCRVWAFCVAVKQEHMYDNVCRMAYIQHHDCLQVGWVL